MSSAFSFCSNPDALRIDESEKGIYDSLNTIAQLSTRSLRGDGQLGSSARGAAGDQALGEADRKSPAFSTGE